MHIGTLIIAIAAVLLTAQALFSLYLMLYTWEHPERLEASLGGKADATTTVFNPSCAATLDSTTSGGQTHSSLVSARCRVAAALQRFINSDLRTFTGAQRTIAQSQYAGSPGNAAVGAALFGETR